MDESTKQPLLSQDEVEIQLPNTINTRTTRWPIIGFLLASNMLCAFGWASTLLQIPQQSQCQENAQHTKADSRIAIMPPLPTKPVQFHWYTAYSSPNDTESNLLWNNVNTAHGFIAQDHSLVAERNWLPSMPLPDQPDKGLYLLESYHQLHCLGIIRKLFFESQSGLPLSYPVQHARHCFDAFRQFIMCHADNTPLYTLGQHTSGDGQWHMCKDWSALKEYATEHSACFRDRVGNETLAEQFGQCGDGSDGLLLDPEVLQMSAVVG